MVSYHQSSTLIMQVILQNDYQAVRLRSCSTNSHLFAKQSSPQNTFRRVNSSGVVRSSQDLASNRTYLRKLSGSLMSSHSPHFKSTCSSFPQIIHNISTLKVL